MDDSFDTYLEKALSAAFAPDADQDEPASPSGEDLREPSPPPAPAAVVPDLIGRYRVTALVGRGGTGLVLGATDPDLDRTVAIKLLHERLGSDPEMRRRFLDEARLTSRLQHPGIPPVHEMGRTGDGLPYFSMRLVEGETLARELFARREPSERRARFLEIFLKVSETVAYAHAAGVVHQDLKPSNVLLGAFGEILVLDWGFAALTAPEPAPAGDSPAAQARIFGTPAYMAPEQARGGHGPPDARTDVFALGAILCEILTLKPPWSGETPSDVLLSASRAWLDDAHERLAACGADAALVAIARRCLAADPAARPAHAGEVAAAVREFLESQESRARALEIQAAEARAHAAHERRQRRLAVGVFSAFALALVVAGAAWAWMQHLSSERVREHERVLQGGATQVRALLRRARETPEPDPRTWEEAVLAADRTLRVSRDLGVGPGDLAELGSLRSQAEAGSVEARKLRHCVERLNAIQEHVEDLRDDRARAAAYQEIFVEAGIGIGPAGDLAADEVARSPIRDALVAALDGWAAARAAGGDVPGAARLLGAARKADGDTWREQVRRTVLAGDPKSLEDLARAPETLDQPPASLVLLGRGLLRGGSAELARRLLETAAIRFPADYGIHHELGILFARGKKPDVAEAIRHFSMALAARPGSVHARLDLVEWLIESGRTAEAEAQVLDALRLEPASVSATHYLGVVRLKQGDPGSAMKLADAALAADTAFAPSHGLRAAILKSAGRWEEAAEATEWAARAEPRSGRFRLLLAEIRDLQGRRDDALMALRDAVRVAPRLAIAWYNLGIHLGADELEESMAAFRKAVDLDPDYAEARCNLADTLSRLGRFEEALEHARRGHELGSARGSAWTYPSATWVKDIERLVALEGMLAGPQEIDVEELPRHRILALAEVACRTKRHRTAVELFRELFAPDQPRPEGLGARHRLLAAAAAVAVGTGDAGSDRAARLEEALGWLTEDLDLLETLAKDEGRSEGCGAILDSWLKDSGLAAVRDEAGLAALPEAARASWIAFWARVASVRRSL